MDPGRMLLAHTCCASPAASMRIFVAPSVSVTTEAVECSDGDEGCSALGVLYSTYALFRCVVPHLFAHLNLHC